MRVAFGICWLFSVAVVLLMPRFVNELNQARYPSGTYPLDGAASTTRAEQYIVFPKVHHAHENTIRVEIENLLLKIRDRGEASAEEVKRWRDSMVDFGRPIIVRLNAPVISDCAQVLERHPTHAIALERAIRSYWRPGVSAQCIEISARVVANTGDDYSHFRANQREIGRTLIMNRLGGALAQVLLWRDDRSSRDYGQVQALDPNLDIGSGLSPFPLDWPNLKIHRDMIRSTQALRIPFDRYVKKQLEARRQGGWRCNMQLLEVDYHDSWGRLAHAQWCYGDAVPKVLENDHYYAYRMEE